MRRVQPLVDPYFVIGLLSVLMIGGMMMWRRSPVAASPLPQLSEQTFAALDSLKVSHSFGSAEAPVHIAVLSDYDCIGCVFAETHTRPVLNRFLAAGQIRVTIYETPLPSHPVAVDVATIAACAAEVMDYVQVREHLMVNRVHWTSTDATDSVLVALVEQLGADPKDLGFCLESRRDAWALATSHAWSIVSRDGATFVPLWIVNGRSVNWLNLEAEIDEALRNAN